jgi:uncharacterized protein (TIGR02421 family)
MAGADCRSSIATASRMLRHLGEPTFHDCSVSLYGAPDQVLADTGRSPLDLARRLRTIIDGMSHIDLGAPADASATADEIARRMGIAVHKFFGDEAPAIEVVDNLSANATAGPDRIRIRSTARFTDRDVEQLIHHEAGIHVTTGLNGRHQTELPILASSHPGTTRTQEGLAVFAEFITGCMDLDRLSRLTDRVIGIQMACEGADFLEVYRLFPRARRHRPAKRNPDCRPRPPWPAKSRLRADPPGVSRRCVERRRAVYQGHRLPRWPAAGA